MIEPIKKKLFVDVETTGLDSRTCSIWQLAYIIDIDGQAVQTSNLRITPPATRQWDKAALTMQHAWLKQHSTNAGALCYDPSVALDKLKADLDKVVDRFDYNDKLAFIGYNARFDWDFVFAWCEMLGFPYFGSYCSFPPIDVAALCFMAEPNKWLESRKHKLGDAARVFGVDVDALDLHDAMTDVKLTRDLYYKAGGS